MLADLFRAIACATRDEAVSAYLAIGCVAGATVAFGICKTWLFDTPRRSLIYIRGLVITAGAVAGALVVAGAGALLGRSGCLPT